MDLNFVLNDCSTSPRTAETTFNIGTTTYEFGPVQHAENPAGFIRQNPTSEIPLPLVYNPYHHQSGQYSALSARSSYSGPSLQSSTAATSPLEISMSAKSLVNLNAENQGYSAINSEDGDASYRRHLPPLNSAHLHPSTTTLSASGEGPSSPHSASHHYHHQNGSDAGYFPPASSHTYTYAQNQQHYQLPIYSTSQHTHNRSCGNSLLTLAEAAMETATPGGRKSLEAEVAAEALTGRRASDGTLRYNDNIARVIREEEQERAARSINLGGNMSSRLNKPGGMSAHVDIEYTPYACFPLS